ncbi:MAG: hypothetical protein IKO49_02265 [Bacilli bacterium]|nr:hypothetical protein [Clostridia bacterium]MBR4618106.1 hypothetical protein [Bacilli bacterium]
MSVLQFNGNEYNILYIDANIGANVGDGSTPATALANIPATLTDKTCYIVRRQEDNEVTYVDLPQSWYDSLYYIMFLGMPKADDPLYNFMEADAKTLWGNDTGKYARIRCNMSSYTNVDNWSGDNFNDTNNKTLLKTNSIRNFYAANCYFYRDGNGGAQSSNANQFGYMFAFDYGSRFADVTFNNCKFGYTQYNFENDDYIANNTDISTDTSKYPQYKCQSYIGIQNCNTFTMNGCIINHVWTAAYGTSYAYYFTRGTAKCIRMRNLNKFIFTNNQYNVLYRNGYNNTDAVYENTNNIVLNDGNTGQESYNNGSQRTKAIVKNIEINRIYTATGARIDAQNLRVDVADLLVNNVHINHKVMHNGRLTSWNFNEANGSFLEFEGYNSLNVSEIYADFTGSNINSARVLKLYSDNNTVGNPKDFCRDIYIKMDPVGTLNMGGSIVDLIRSYYMLNNTTSIENVDRNNDWDIYGYHANMTESSIVNNIVVEAENTTNYAIYCERFGFKSPFVKGRVYLGNSTADIKKHYNKISTSTGALVYGSSYYKCDDYEANLEYPNYNGTTQIAWQPNGRSSVYINKSNCILYNEMPTTSIYLASSNNSFVCPNYIKTGQFFQRNEVCFCKSWNTVRTGSNSQGSLRFNNNYAGINNNSYPLIVGHEPYSGIQIVPNSIGKKILTAYMAHKNMDASELGYINRIGIHVICPEKYTDYFDNEKINTRHHEFVSEAVGWEPDTSTWSGDTNLRTYKCEIPIEVYTLEDPIDVKIWFNWYSVNGYVYVDPDFKLRDVVE